MIGVQNNRPGTGGGGATFSKVQFQNEIGLKFVSSINNIQSSLNLVSVTLEPGEIVTLICGSFINGTNGLIKISKFIFKNNGLTTVYSPANPILANQLIEISKAYPTPDNIGLIAAAANTFYRDLGNIGSSTLVAYLAALGEIFDFRAIDKVYYFRCVISGVDCLYQFVGAAASRGFTYYGGGGSLDFITSDFFLFYSSQVAVAIASGNRPAKYIETIPSGDKYRFEPADVQYNLILNGSGNISLDLRASVNPQFALGAELIIINPSAQVPEFDAPGLAYKGYSFQKKQTMHLVKTAANTWNRSYKIDQLPARKCVFWIGGQQETDGFTGVQIRSNTFDYTPLIAPVIAEGEGVFSISGISKETHCVTCIPIWEHGFARLNAEGFLITMDAARNRVYDTYAQGGWIIIEEFAL